MCRIDYTLGKTGICYKVYIIAKNQEDASKQCKADGGYLINVDTDVKYGNVKNLSGFPTTYTYIGGRRKDTNSPWMFEHGSTSGYFKWASEEADNRSNELCLVLNGSDKLMYDSSCSLSRPFVCELNV
ncbi:C-type lectin BML-1-like [Mercenaria mercenaria]|uniref:C-type lectin BML-1-like n=1 Tax=Mercenaria mercenaria TaxID=6596 RepID=UPI00234F0FA8|nr:C-type lectin BML-1-like [Mercenaria mercenaria]